VNEEPDDNINKQWLSLSTETVNSFVFLRVSMKNAH